MSGPIDIKDMPGFNPAVTNGIDSVSRGLVKMEPYYYPDGEHLVNAPACHRHGAMLRVSKEGIYRCGELGCDNGCYCP